VPIINKKEIKGQVFVAEIDGQSLKMTATPIVSGAASSSLYSSPSASATAEVMLHATDLTLLGALPKLDNLEFVEFIAETLEKQYGAKRLLVTAPENVDALKKQGYEVCNPTDKALVPYGRMKANLKNLDADNKARAEHFAAYQAKLDSSEWQFVYGAGPDFMKKLELEQLLAFYGKHCPFATGGFKTQYDTYGEDAMMARFFYPSQAVTSFAIMTKSGELIAANHLLFTNKNDKEEKAESGVAYCYDNVVHGDSRSQHVYQFFLSQIAVALEKERREPNALVIIMGVQGQAGNGQKLRQLLIGEKAEQVSASAPVLMFKGGQPEPGIVRAIVDEKVLAKQHFEAYITARNHAKGNSLSLTSH
jgi:hypothetical protein